MRSWLARNTEARNDRIGSNSSFNDKESKEWRQLWGRGVSTRDMFVKDSTLDDQKRVAIAAVNLGSGIKKAMTTARMERVEGKPELWKTELLELLGGSDEDIESGSHDPSTSFIDFLIISASCENFHSHCLEKELPPNLIHSLRLLRVLEIQNTKDTPVSAVATAKVTSLLCLLCADVRVGEQLRPLLFGILPLAAASYPASGVHVAHAASSIIRAYAESCFSKDLIRFMHRRKIIIHLIDDIKELCGMVRTSKTGDGPLNEKFNGEPAERAGLWVLSLQTLVHLVRTSCDRGCVHLLEDFKTAKGYDLLYFAITRSRKRRIPELLEQVLTLSCCLLDEGGQTSRIVPQRNFAGEHNIVTDIVEVTPNRLATNPDAFAIVEELMFQSVPVLIEYVRNNNGYRPILSQSESLVDIAAFSIDRAWMVRSHRERKDDVAGLSMMSELLAITAELYFQQGENFFIVESKYNILTHFILAIPTMHDLGFKALILEMLEYVNSGLPGPGCSTPLNAASEVFFALCNSLLRRMVELDLTLPNDEDDGDVQHIERKQRGFDELNADASILFDSLEKLLQLSETMGVVDLDDGGNNNDDNITSKRKESENQTTSKMPWMRLFV